jgi:trigger factor
MQVTKEPLEPCQVALTIEVEPGKVAQAVDRAYREYAKYVSVPGFRKGKAPMNFVRQRVPVGDVRQRTAELLVEPAYNDAIKQEEVTPYAQPKLELLDLDLTEMEKPFIFKAIVPLAPQVDLGPYTGLAAERNVYVLTDEDVDEQIARMRERAADFPQVERPIQTGDLVIGDVTVLTEARPDADAPRPTMIEVGAEGNIPGIDENLLGLSTGETKTFTVTYPEEYAEEDLAGEEAEFTVVIKEVRARELPPLGDELAQKISNGSIQTLDVLKANLRADMERNLAQNSERLLEQSLVDQVVAASTIKYPPVLVDAEVEEDAKQFMERLEREKVTLDDYLVQSGRTREQVMAEFQETANKRLQIGLVLGVIAEKEGLAVTPADVDAAIAAQAETQRIAPAALRAMLEAQGAMDGLTNRAQTKKVLDFLRASAIITDKEVHSHDADPDTMAEAGDAAEDEVLEAAEMDAIDQTITESSNA